MYYLPFFTVLLKYCILLIVSTSDAIIDFKILFYLFVLIRKRKIHAGSDEQSQVRRRSHA